MPIGGLVMAVIVDPTDSQTRRRCLARISVIVLKSAPPLTDGNGAIVSAAVIAVALDVRIEAARHHGSPAHINTSDVASASLAVLHVPAAFTTRRASDAQIVSEHNAFLATVTA